MENEKEKLTSDIINMSGTGKTASVPQEVLGHFNWGAFLLSWIWGIGNKTYITLLIFISLVTIVIPIIGIILPLGLCIWFGIKGNEWAWQNKKWKDIEHFHNNQRKWAIAGLSLFLIHIFSGLMLSVLKPVKFVNEDEIRDKMIIRGSEDTLSLLAERDFWVYTGKLDSEKVAEYFNKNIFNKQQKGSIINVKDNNSIWIFNINGNCSQLGDCSIQVKSAKTNKILIDAPLYIDSANHIYIKESDLEKYKI